MLAADRKDGPIAHQRFDERATECVQSLALDEGSSVVFIAPKMGTAQPGIGWTLVKCPETIE